MPKPKRYSLIHTWLHHNFRNEKKECEFCGFKNDLQFARRKGKKHAKNIKSYIILCRECHLSYDYENRCKKCEKRCRNKLCSKHIQPKRNKIRPTNKVCDYCRKTFICKYRKKRFCSTTCRVCAFYRNHNQTPYEYLKLGAERYLEAKKRVRIWQKNNLEKVKEIQHRLYLKRKEQGYFNYERNHNAYLRKKAKRLAELSAELLTPRRN